ncbi:thioesterase family protein [Nocardioides marinquilinus]|uniref:Thioesterase family protein n=1 Tax=Nocardioides marinquilinus TaxID=1210400 RepID=A0ABP9PEF8_9ACTN
MLDRATAVTGQDGAYRAGLDAGWVVGGGVNGGYLLAVAAQALGAELADRPDPVALSAYYLSASRPGPADVDVRVLREGGSTATAAADVSQDGVARLSVLATFGDLGRQADDVRTTAVRPDLPPPEECVSHRDATPEEFLDASPLLRRFDLRFDPAALGWARGRPDDSGVLTAWFRLEDEREPDPLALLLAVDALPPVTFTFGAMGWAPTLELTAHVRARPAPGWLLVTHRTRNMAGGLFEEDCEVWDAAGRLVAQSRQLARLPR